MATPTVTPGSVLAGKYRIERVLGEGGMGVVVAAEHIELHDRVAIKFLLEDYIKDDAIVQRFLTEARAARKIKSEHAAKVLDVGTLPETGAPYIVMELLEGIDLRDLLLKQGALSYDLAIECVLQACEALAEAHAAGIVHRDIKPENLFLTQHADGSPCAKVLDFGIAKIASNEGMSVTRTRVMVGTALYAPPEQIHSSKDVDARSDIWALGTTLFELLTGEPPFIGEDLPGLVATILTEPPKTLKSLRADVPEGLDDVIAKALEKERENRYQNIGEFALALEPFAPPRAVGSIERTVRTLERATGVMTDPTQYETTGSRNAAARVQAITDAKRTVRAAATAAAVSQDPPLTPAPKQGSSAWIWTMLGFAALVVGALATFGTRLFHAKPVPAATASSASTSASHSGALASASGSPKCVFGAAAGKLTIANNFVTANGTQGFLGGSAIGYNIGAGGAPVSTCEGSLGPTGFCSAGTVVKDREHRAGAFLGFNLNQGDRPSEPPQPLTTTVNTVTFHFTNVGGSDVRAVVATGGPACQANGAGCTTYCYPLKNAQSPFVIAGARFNTRCWATPPDGQSWDGNGATQIGLYVPSARDDVPYDVCLTDLKITIVDDNASGQASGSASSKEPEVALSITSPLPASCEIAGKSLGHTPIVTKRAPGNYVVTCKNVKGFQTHNVSITAGHPVTLTLK